MISVVTPSLNSGDYIVQAIESVFEQGREDTEVVVQDGGSKDGTLKLLAALDDGRISVVSGPDRSQADALNRAIARAKGEWIVWLNADDVIAPGAFAASEPFLRTGDSDLVFGDFAYIDAAGHVTREVRVAPVLDRRRLLIRGCYPFSGTMFFHRSVFERFGTFDPELDFAMDYDFYLRIALGVRTRHIPRVLAHFRDHVGSRTNTQAWGITREGIRVRRRHGGLAPATIVPASLNQLKQSADLMTRSLRASLRPSQAPHGLRDHREQAR